VDRAAEGERGPGGQFHGARVEHGQRAGEAEAHGTDVGVGRIAEAGAAAAEHLALRQQLRVNLEADDGLNGQWSGVSGQWSMTIAH
jgi:hypothetical protein